MGVLATVFAISAACAGAAQVSAHQSRAVPLDTSVTDGKHDLTAVPRGEPLLSDRTAPPSEFQPDKTEQEVIARLFRMLDFDEDGYISPGEFSMHSDEDSTGLDADDDGSISLRELGNAAAQIGFMKKFKFQF